MENITDKINELKEQRKRELCDKLGLYDEKRTYSEKQSWSIEYPLFEYATSKYYNSEKIYPSMSDEEFDALNKYANIKDEKNEMEVEECSNKLSNNSLFCIIVSVVVFIACLVCGISAISDYNEVAGIIIIVGGIINLSFMLGFGRILKALSFLVKK